MKRLTYIDRDNYPIDFFEKFDIEFDEVILQPKTDTIESKWNGEHYYIQVEQYDKISLNFPVTEEAAKTLYEIKRAQLYVYYDGVQYEVESLSDREAIGTTEFRKFEIILTKKEPVITNYFSSNHSGYNNCRLILNAIDVTISGFTQTYYSRLTPLESKDSVNETENWNGQSIVKYSQNKSLATFRTYLSNEDKQELETYIKLVDETVFVETDNYVLRQGQISVDSSGKLTGLTEDGEKLLTEGVKLVNNSVGGLTYTVVTKNSTGITVTPATAASNFTWKSEKAYPKINVVNFEASEVGIDLYEVEIVISQAEAVEIPDGDYDLYIYNSNSNDPEGWTDVQDSDDQLVYNSNFEPLRGYESEREVSDRTGKALVENIKFKFIVNWKLCLSSELEAFYLEAYSNLCDFVRLVEKDNLETQTGRITINTSGAVTVASSASFSNLRPGMKISAAAQTFEITAWNSSTSMTVSPSPSSLLNSVTWKAEKQYVIEQNTTEVSKNKNEAGIYELELKMTLVTDNNIHYPYDI